MNAILLVFVFWLPFLLPALPVAIGCWIGCRQRVHWFKWERIVLLAPYAIWLSLAMIGGDGKSMSNAVVEPFLLGCGAAVACGIRALVGNRMNEKLTAVLLLLAVCTAAVVLWACVPAMAE